MDDRTKVRVSRLISKRKYKQARKVLEPLAIVDNEALELLNRLNTISPSSTGGGGNNGCSLLIRLMIFASVLFLCGFLAWIVTQVNEDNRNANETRSLNATDEALGPRLYNNDGPITPSSNTEIWDDIEATLKDMFRNMFVLRVGVTASEEVIIISTPNAYLSEADAINAMRLTTGYLASFDVALPNKPNVRFERVGSEAQQNFECTYADAAGLTSISESQGAAVGYLYENCFWD